MKGMFRLPDMEAFDALQQRLTGPRLPGKATAARELARLAGELTVTATKPKSKRSGKSKIEALMGEKLAASDLPAPVEQHKYLEKRRYKADYAWPIGKIALEVEGGAHTIKKRFEQDAERHNSLVLAGWRVIRVTGDMVRDGRALAVIKRAFEELK